MTTTTEAMNKAQTAEDYLRGKYGAYRGHYEWRALEEAFNAGKAAALSSAEAQPVYFYREKGRGNWIECSADTQQTLSAQSDRFEYRTLYAAPQSSQPIGQPVDSDIWPIVNIDVDESGNVTNAKLYAPGLPAGNHDVYPVRVPYMDEHTEAWLACSDAIKEFIGDYLGRDGMNGIESAVAAIRELGNGWKKAHAQPVSGAVTDEQIDALVKSVCHSDPVMASGEYYLTVDEVRDLLSAHQAPSEKAPDAYMLFDRNGEAFGYSPKSRPMKGLDWEPVYRPPLQSTPAQAPVSVPEGWKLVPISPTPEMMQAGFDIPGSHAYGLTYRAMVAAAPAQAQQSEKDATAEAFKKAERICRDHADAAGHVGRYYLIEAADKIAALSSEQNKASGEKGGA